MILLRPDCLVFETPEGESIPCSATQVTIELTGQFAQWLEPELIENAAAAVLHYFRVEQERVSVSVAEFARALEQVLGGLGLEVQAEPGAAHGEPAGRPVSETDLRALAGDSAEGGELFFFPLLRQELRRRLDGRPQVLRFRGLRGCVKSLARARRWSPRCRALNDRIVDYLRTCFISEPASAGSALVVL